MKVWDVVADLKQPHEISEAPFGADVRVLVEALMRRGGAGCYIARDEREALSALALARFFRPDLEMLLLPGWDCLPYDRVSPSADSAAQRCAALARLSHRTGDAPLFVVATASGLVQRAAPRRALSNASLAASVNADVDQADMLSYLEINGYTRTDIVREHGEFAVRGGIIDIFPPETVEPVRLDFFGDTLDTLRTFDPETQRSTGQLKTISLAPVSEIFFDDDALSAFRRGFLENFGPPGGDPMYEAARARIRRQGVEHWLPLFHEKLETIFDYLGQDVLLGISAGAKASAIDRLEMAREYHSARMQAAGGEIQEAKVLPPDALYLLPDELSDCLSNIVSLRFHPREVPPRDHLLFGRSAPGRDFAVERANPGANVFDAVIAYVRGQIQKKRKVIFAAWTTGSADRLKTMLADHGLEDLEEVEGWSDARSAPGPVVAELPLAAGFESDDLVVVSEQDILGDKLARPRKKRKTANFISEIGALSPGDLVVHVDHGVGRYVGLRTVEFGDAAHDCLELVYAGDDKVLVPVENIELITRYGAGGNENSIDKLGGGGWQTRKAKAKRDILEMAEDLIKIAAERALRRAEKTANPDGLFDEFCARFPYEETDDQLNAIEDAISDLGSGKPMDRLVCGDVGFGKTEVALRSAFIAAMSGMQVAVIAPTTLLARQHFNTFSARFEGWPLRVRHLSRFVSTKEASKTRDMLADGSCDVVVGTHAVLSSQVRFKHLGLLVIDEEQRFGVKHKERLKELKADVHVLTLSATPIPRTLQLALTGIRDLSIIATPPVDRLAVRTYVMEFDNVAIREALLRERYRGGQAYIVAPRVSDLPFLERFLKEEVPEVSFLTAHGQMATGQLEDIMTRFYEGKAEVLLSTTIVESGIDIPRANTMIIHRADMFGLGQLYQLRGRVGRSKLRAYAYLTTKKDMVLTDAAEKRLKVLQSLDSLGAGFMLASHDLDMRGGGNLLGDAQSGHVREVGVELYQQMLEDAVKALRTGEAEPMDDWSPSIDLGAAVLIPESYVENLTERLSLYRRLADLDTEQERAGFAAELIDRFGPLPDETKQLLEITAIKQSCKAAGISKLNAGPKGATISFRDDAPIDPQKLVAFVHANSNRIKLRPDRKLVLNGVWPDPQSRMKAVKHLMRDLSQIAPVVEQDQD